MKKRAQFFILTAVLIASIVFSLSIAKNVLIGKETPPDFYPIGEQLQREVSAVLDYDLVSGGNKTSTFINGSVQHLRATKPYTEIIFMYYQNGNLTVENYANRTVNVSGFSPCISPQCSVAKDLKITKSINITNIANLTMNSQVFTYNLSKGSKSYIVVLRNISNEVYVDVKE